MIGATMISEITCANNASEPEYQESCRAALQILTSVYEWVGVLVSPTNY